MFGKTTRKFKYACGLIFLSGCASTTPIPEAWIGHTEEELVSSWGPPHRQVVLDDGSTTFVYEGSLSIYYRKHSESELATLGRPNNSDPILGLEDSGIRGFRNACRIMYNIFQSRVRAWQWEGKMCARIANDIQRREPSDT